MHVQSGLQRQHVGDHLLRGVCRAEVAHADSILQRLDERLERRDVAVALALPSQHHEAATLGSLDELVHEACLADAWGAGQRYQPRLTEARIGEVALERGELVVTTDVASQSALDRHIERRARVAAFVDRERKHGPGQALELARRERFGAKERRDQPVREMLTTISSSPANARKRAARFTPSRGS